MSSFTIFGVNIHLYGVIIAFAMITGIFVASYNAKKRNISVDDITTLAIIVIPLAIIGARLLFVLSNLNLYTSIWQMIATWNGGLSIIGGVMGGAIGVAIFGVWKKKSFLDIADIAVPSLILGQAIGRWGNFVNQEVYGSLITNPVWQWFPFGVFVQGQWFHALFFYESILNLIGFAVLMVLLYKVKKKGTVLAGYLMFYGLIRFIMEPMREPEFIMRVFGLPISQILSGMIFAVGLVLIINLNCKKKIVHTNSIQDN